jgi:hypothetical protein
MMYDISNKLDNLNYKIESLFLDSYDYIPPRVK